MNLQSCFYFNLLLCKSQEAYIRASSSVKLTSKQQFGYLMLETLLQAILEQSLKKI